MRVRMPAQINGILPVLVGTLFVLAVLAAAWLVGTIVAGERIPLIFVAALPVGLIAVVLILQHIRYEYSVLLILLSAGLIGFFTLPTGRESRVPMSMVITLAALGIPFLKFVTQQSRLSSLRASPVVPYVVAFVVINVISFFWGILFRDPLVYVWGSFTFVQLAALVVNCALPIVTLLCLNSIHSLRGWYILVWSTILVGMFGLGSVLLSLPTDVMTSNGARGLFSVWAGGFSLALLLFGKNLSTLQKGLLFAIVVGYVFRNVIQGVLWLSGWVPMVIAWFILLWIRSRKLGLLALLLLLVFAAFNSGLLYEQIVQANIDEGSDSRVGIWAMNLELVRNHPIFGMGPAGYAVYNMTYHPEDARSTHNNYFDVLAQSGIVGLAAFLLMMLKFLQLGLKNIRRVGADNDFASALAAMSFAGACGAMVGMALGDWVLPFAYNQTIAGFDNSVVTWVYLGAIVSLDWLIRDGRVKEREDGAASAP